MRYEERAYVGCGGKTTEGGHSRLQCLCSLETFVSIIFLPLAGSPFGCCSPFRHFSCFFCVHGLISQLLRLSEVTWV